MAVTRREDTSSRVSRSRRARAAMRVVRALTAVRGRWIFALALALHAAVLAVRDTPFVHTENLRAGFTLATKGYLGDPFSAPTGPTGHLAPFYPLLVAAVHRLTHGEERTVAVLGAIGAVAASFAASLLLPLARRMRLPPGTGALAALPWVFPFFTWIELSAEHETVFTAVAVVLVLMLVFDRLAATRLDGPDGAMLGAATGVGAYFSPLIPPMAILAIAAGWRARRRSLRAAPRALGAFAFVLAATVTPYTIRNWAVLGAPFFMRDNLGLELAVSNGDVADPTAEANLERNATMTSHPYASTSEAERVRAMGEVAYNRSRLHDALAWIRTHPARFAELTAERAGLLILPWSTRPYQRVFAGAVSVLCLLGLLFQWRSGARGTAATAAGALAGYQGIYLFVQHDIRYVYPMMWLQSVVAAALVLSLLRGEVPTGAARRAGTRRLSGTEGAP